MTIVARACETKTWAVSTNGRYPATQLAVAEKSRYTGSIDGVWTCPNLGEGLLVSQQLPAITWLPVGKSVQLSGTPRQSGMIMCAPPPSPPNPWQGRVGGAGTLDGRLAPAGASIAGYRQLVVMRPRAWCAAFVRDGGFE